MTLDLTTAKVGDRLLLKNDAIVEIDGLDPADKEMPIYAHGYWYAYDGKCMETFDGAGEFDAIKLLPPSESPQPPSPSGWIFDGEDSSLTVIGVDIHPTTINCNNKIYTPADSWPEPITDRRPSKEDADADGRVQWLSPPGCWLLAPWQHGYGCPGWQHTPNWKAPAPKPPTLKEATESVVEYYYNGGGINDEFAAIMDTLKTALEATK